MSKTIKSFRLDNDTGQGTWVHQSESQKQQKKSNDLRDKTSLFKLLVIYTDKFAEFVLRNKIGCVNYTTALCEGGKIPSV